MQEELDYILCKLCNNGKHYKMLTAFHMQNLHGITLKEYQVQFLGAPIICQNTLDKRAKSRQRNVTIICQWCSEEFEVRPHQAHYKFCSDVCRNASRCGDGNPAKRPEVRAKIKASKPKKTATFICEWCGKEKTTTPYLAKHQKFCSPECKALAQCGDGNVTKRSEVAAKISASKMGHKVTEETIKKIKAAWTPELKKQVQDKLKPQRAEIAKKIEVYWDDPQNRERQSNVQKEVQNQPETKERSRQVSIECWQDTEYREHQIETHKQFWSDPEEREKQRQRQNQFWEENPERRETHMQDFYGDKNPNWQGGKSFEPYSPEFNKILKRHIRQRDRHTCQCCGAKARSVHHIDYDKHDNIDENLIILCKSCHSKTNFNREFWQQTFQVLIQFRYEAGYYSESSKCPE